MHLRLVTDPATERPSSASRPDHRSPRWLGLLSLGLGMLTISQVIVAFESLTHLLR